MSLRQVSPDVFQAPGEPKPAPVDVLIGELAAMACRYGGRNYREGMVDGAGGSRWVRERGEESKTDIRFDANRVRENPGSENFYTVYSVEVEVSGDIDAEELPDHVLKEALNLYEPSELADALIQKKERLIYFIRDDIKFIQPEIEVSFLVDENEVYSISTADSEGDDFDTEDDDDQTGGVAVLEPEPELVEDDDQEDSRDLIEQAWELLTGPQAHVENNEILIDPAMVKMMARINKRLEWGDEKEQRLLLLAGREIHEVQVKNWRRILRKLRAGVSI